MSSMALLEKTVAQIHQDYTPLNNVEQRLFGKATENQLHQIIEEKSKDLDSADAQRLQWEFFSWGPLEELFNQTNLSEIVINGPDDLFYEDRHGFHRLDDHFLSPLTFQNFVRRLCQQCGSELTLEHPFVNGSFKNFRVHIAGPPVCSKVTLTLRKHLAKTLSLESYVEDGIVSTEQRDILQDLVQQKKNLLVVGNTGSGKTTLLNGLLRSLKEQRLVFIEDTEELAIPNDLSVRMLTRKNRHSTQTDIPQQELLRQALRMRPDRLIMGEIRDQEAKDFLQALATGHEGSMGTLHANSPQQAMYRLEMLVQMGAPQWDLEAIRRLIYLSLTHLVVIQRDKVGRRLEGIYQLGSLEKFGFLINKLA